MNTYHWRMMTQEPNRNLPKIKYHHDRVWLGLRDHIITLQEILEILETSRTLPYEEYNILRLTDIVANERLLTSTIDHILKITTLKG